MDGSPKDEPKGAEVPGQCHICLYKDGEKGTRPIRYCMVCGHWFCGPCRWRYWSRFWSLVDELIGPDRPNCCGPKEE